MRYRFFFLILSFFVNENALPQSKVTLSSSFSVPISIELKPFYAPSEGQIEDLLKGVVISTSSVSTPKPNTQQMMLFTSGVHPRNCTRAMRKLSLYENYHEYIDFIKKSEYNDQTEKVSFLLDHTLMPFPMTLSFKIPRIKKAGHFPFTFEDGFLKDLKGTIIVHEVGKYCLLGLKTDWKGPETRIPNLIFETFVQTVGKMGLEHLIRVSLF